MATTSQLFCPFRAIGFCSNHVPLVALTKGTDSFVATAIGRSFHVYLVRDSTNCSARWFCSFQLIILFLSYFTV